MLEMRMGRRGEGGKAKCGEGMGGGEVKEGEDKIGFDRQNHSERE